MDESTINIRMHRIEKHCAETTIANARDIYFCVTELPKILKYFNILEYAIGGSVAAYMQGVDYGRRFHDIDVIVPKGTIDILKEKLVNDPYFKEDESTSSTDVEFATKHIAIKSVNTPYIDFIENVLTEESILNCYYKKNGINVVDLAGLILSKEMYNRYKDIQDLDMLKTKFNERFDHIVNRRFRRTKKEETNNELPELPKVEKTTLGDLEALAALKAQLDAEAEKIKEHTDETQSDI